MVTPTSTPTINNATHRSRRSTPSGVSPLLLFLVLSLFLALFAAPARASLKTTCLHQCAVCQNMYGDHFEGHVCARSCIDMGGRSVPDCTDLSSIAPYLDLSNFLEDE